MQKITLIVLALVIGLVSVAIYFSSQVSEPKITDLNPSEFAKLINQKGVFTLDTHIPEQEHIEGTDAFIPFNELQAYMSKLPSDKSTPIAVYCRSGSMSSAAAQTLQKMGYTNIYNLAGGVNAWKVENKPLASYQFGSPDSLVQKVTVYKSPNCGCCVGYIAELKKQGFEVEVVSVSDMSSIKSKYGVPMTMQSCHTIIIGDYFVEGHVPFEAVMKLLTERPQIDGISLPGMPSGSPGMPGIKLGEFTIYSITDGEISVFMKI